MTGRKFLRFRSLQQKLGLYAFTLSLLAMVAVSIVTYIFARNQVQRDREELMESLAQEIARTIQTELQNSVQELRMWANLDLFQTLLRDGQSERASAFLDNITRYSPDYDLIFTIDPRGLVTSINGVGQQDLGTSCRNLLPDLPDSWVMNLVEDGTLRGLGWRQLPRVNELNRRTEVSPRETTYQIVLLAPMFVTPGETELGFLVAVLSWSHIQGILDRAEDGFRNLGLTTGYAYLLNSTGDFSIAHKYRDIYGTDLTTVHNLPELAERARSNPTGTIRYKWVEGWKIVALEKIDPGELGSEFGWVVCVGINDDDIFAPVRQLGYWFLLIPVSVALPVFLLNLYLGRSVSVSLNEFAQLAKDAARGRFSQLARARTGDEIGDLAQAFNEMLVAFRSEIPFQRIPNPYIVGNPIRTGSMFFGRKEDLDWVGRQLELRGNKMILLFGPRRIGKTSILHQIGQGGATTEILPFFLDTQQMIPEIERNADFYHVLTREMLSQLPNVLPGSEAPFIAAERFTPVMLRRLIEFLNDSGSGKRPVLLFDELENLEYKITRGSLSADPLLFLASLLDGELPISIVATGSDQLENLKYGDWNILNPKTIPRRIGLLTRQDALRLIREPVRGYVLYEEGVPERILRLTAGHPYYTQVVCQACVDYLNEKCDSSVSIGQFTEVEEVVLSNPPPPLIHMWDTLSPIEKAAAAGLAQALPDMDAYAGMETILESLPSALRSDAEDHVSLGSTLNDLRRTDWIEANFNRAEYRFRLDLLRSWIRREHSVWEVADELRRNRES